MADDDEYEEFLVEGYTKVGNELSARDLLRHLERNHRVLDKTFVPRSLGRIHSFSWNLLNNVSKFKIYENYDNDSIKLEFACDEKPNEPVLVSLPKERNQYASFKVLSECESDTAFVVLNRTTFLFPVFNQPEANEAIDRTPTMQLYRINLKDKSYKMIQERSDAALVTVLGDVKNGKVMYYVAKPLTLQGGKRPSCMVYNSTSTEPILELEEIEDTRLSRGTISNDQVYLLIRTANQWFPNEIVSYSIKKKIRSAQSINLDAPSYFEPIENWLLVFGHERLSHSRWRITCSLFNKRLQSTGQQYLSPEGFQSVNDTNNFRHTRWMNLKFILTTGKCKTSADQYYYCSMLLFTVVKNKLKVVQLNPEARVPGLSMCSISTSYMEQRNIFIIWIEYFLKCELYDRHKNKYKITIKI